MKKALVSLGLLAALPLLSGCQPAWLLAVLLLLQGSSPVGVFFEVPPLTAGQAAVITMTVLAPAGRQVQGLEVSPWAGDFLAYDPVFLQVEAVEAVPPWQLDAFRIDPLLGRIYFVARVPPEGAFPSRGEVLRLHVRPLRAGESALSGSLTHAADADNLPLDLPVMEASFSIHAGSRRS